MNKPKTNNKGDINKVSAMDVCQTPPHALEPLYPYLPKDWVIWESAAGPEELLATELRKRGYSVHATDLLYGECYNYFSYQSPKYDVEITNMPFSIKYKWLEKAFEYNKPFALLAPYETTAAAAFKSLFERYNGKPWQIEKLTPERRLNFKMPNMGWGITEWSEKKQKVVKKGDSSQMPTCWITWGLNIHHTKNIDDTLFEYYVPMRSVKYDENNIERTSNAKTKKNNS